MTYPLEKALLSSYRSVYQWRFFYHNTGPVLAHHFRLIRALDGLKLPPQQTLLASLLGLHLAMSARSYPSYSEKHPNTKRRERLGEMALDILEEVLADPLAAQLSPKALALLYLTGFWIHQRSAAYRGTGGTQEESYIMLRKGNLAKWRDLASARLMDLDVETRTIAVAMLTASNRKCVEIHRDLHRQAEHWWCEGKPDGPIYTLRDQVNKTFLSSPCFWLMDATLECLIDDLPETMDAQDLQSCREAHQQKHTSLANRYLANYPERANGHFLKYSIQHRGWRVHASAASRDIQLIDDILDARLPDKITASVLYQFDDYHSTGTAHAKFRARLARHGVPLTEPVTIAERKDILRQEAFFASLPSRKTA